MAPKYELSTATKHAVNRAVAAAVRTVDHNDPDVLAVCIVSNSTDEMTSIDYSHVICPSTPSDVVRAIRRSITRSLDAAACSS